METIKTNTTSVFVKLRTVGKTNKEIITRLILYNCDMYCKYKTKEHHFLDGSGREMPKLLQIKKSTWSVLKVMCIFEVNRETLLMS